MKTYIALFRGINVGGANILPMKELRTLLEKNGFQDVKTYIQSGNVVFNYSGEEKADKLSDKITSVVKKKFGFEPKVLLLSAEDVKRAMKANPFPEGESEPKSLHLNFLEAKPSKPDMIGLEGIKKKSERVSLKGKVFYVHAPEGIGRSKLVSKMEKLIGVPMTGRNWRTVCKIMEMVEN